MSPPGSSGSPASPEATVLYARHGQSLWNLEHRFQGQADIELTDLGRSQADVLAAAVAERVGDQQHVTVVSSDLVRASETAERVAAALGTGLRLDPRLREAHAGQWQGLLHDEIRDRWPEDLAAWRAGEDVRLGGAERPSEAGQRVAAAVRQYEAAARERLGGRVDGHPGGAVGGSGGAVGGDGGAVVVLVGHGASLRAGVAELLGWPGARAVLTPAGNTCSAELRRRRVVGQGGGPDWSLVRWNVPPQALAATSPERSAVAVASSLVI